jgi:Tfp pilus assembly protein PilF/predicted aspartyl protease
MKNWIKSPKLWLAFIFCFLVLVAVAEQAQTSRPGQLDKAQALLKEGELPAAKEETLRILKLSPDSLQASLLLTKILLIQDELDLASEQIKKAVERNPNDPFVLTANGLYLLREGEFTNAEAQLRKSLRLNPNQAEAHLAMGRLQLSRLQVDQSLASFEKAIRLAPEMEDTYFYISDAYGATRNYAQQAKSLEKYLALKPKFYPERVQNAEALLKFFRSFENEPVGRVKDLQRSYEISSQPFFGLMIVEAYINDSGPYRFLVDTGATSTVISDELIDQLKIPVITSAVIKCVGETGKTTTHLCKAAKMRIGPVEISNLPVSSFDNKIFQGLIDGVLSTSDLADFLITLDYPEQKILLEPRGAGKGDKDRSVQPMDVTEVNFRLFGNLILVPLSINGHANRNFLFDTGAVMSALSKRQASILGVHEDTPNAKVDIEFAGACGIAHSVLGVDKVLLGLGKIKKDYAKILAIQLGEISKEVGSEVSGILGGDFYSTRVVKIDYRVGTIRIE